MIDRGKLNTFYDIYCIVYSSPEEEREAVSLGIKACSIWDLYRHVSKLYGVSYGGTYCGIFDDDGVYVTYEEAKQLLGFNPIWCSSS